MRVILTALTVALLATAAHADSTDDMRECITSMTSITETTTRATEFAEACGQTIECAVRACERMKPAFKEYDSMMANATCQMMAALVGEAFEEFQTVVTGVRITCGG